MKKLRKLNRSFHWAAIVGVAVLASCSTQEVAINSRADTKSELVDLIWEVANTKNSAASETILPSFGINDAPKPSEKKTGYSYASIYTTQANEGGQTQLRMIALGLDSISYDVQLLSEQSQVRKYLNIQLNKKVVCITPETVMARFGVKYKKAPARIVAPISASVEFPAGQPPPRENDITAMVYGPLLHGHGSVRFTFEFQRCAESVTFNSLGKL